MDYYNSDDTRKAYGWQKRHPHGWALTKAEKMKKEIPLPKSTYGTLNIATNGILQQ